MKHYSSTIIAALFLFTSSFAQSKKEIKTNKIKSTTEFTTEIISGKEVTYKSSYSVFDKEGNTVEKQDFMPDGTLKKKSTAKYDGKGNKIEETNFVAKDDKSQDDPKPDSKNTRTVSKFNSAGDKTEEIVSDAISGKQLKKTQTSYTGGNKMLEVVFDTDNKLTKKSVYTYDKKNLRIERKTYDGNNVLVEGKKFVYQF